MLRSSDLSEFPSSRNIIGAQADKAQNLEPDFSH